MAIRAASFLLALVLLVSLPEVASAAPLPPTQPLPAPVDPLPFLSIPDLVGPVTLLLPWQCGYCAPGVAPLQRMSVPAVTLDPFTWSSWLAAMLYNTLLPLICWLLAIGQAILNQVSNLINDFVMPAINVAWRLAVYAWLAVRSVVLAVWSLAWWLVAQLWAGWGWLLQLGALLGGWQIGAQGVIDLAAAILASIWSLALAVFQALAYLLALVLAFIAAIWQGITNPTMPPQLAAIEHFFLFVWMREALQAIADSKLGWAWLAFIGVFYVRFVRWFLAEASTLNS